MAKTPRVTAEFLDTRQYTRTAIEAYESIYGRDFVSPGGAGAARELIDKLALEPDARVLDVGCGLGGSAFLMAREYGLRVDGIDLSQNMLAIAQQKSDAYGLSDRVMFEQGDCLALDRPACYDAVYSRDVFLHIHDKSKLFDVLHNLLKPGGHLLFTDYCCGKQPWADDFADYVTSRAYCLHTLPEYVALVETAGFVDVDVHDWSNRFRAILEAELMRIRLETIDDDARAKLETGWLAKLRWVESGNHRWGMIKASSA